jgi:hypothetical protein
VQKRRVLLTTFALAALGGAWIVAAAALQVPTPQFRLPQLNDVDTKPITIEPEELARGDLRWAVDSLEAPWIRSGDQRKTAPEREESMVHVRFIVRPKEVDTWEAGYTVITDLSATEREKAHYRPGDSYRGHDYGPKGAWLPSGHRVEATFQEIPRWITPDPLVFEVEQDGQTVTCEYTRKPK